MLVIRIITKFMMVKEMEKETFSITNINEFITTIKRLIDKIIFIRKKVLTNNPKIDEKSQDVRLVSLSMLVSSYQFLHFYFKNFIVNQYSEAEIKELFLLESKARIVGVDYISNLFLKYAILDYNYFIFDNLFYNLLDEPKRRMTDNLKAILNSNDKDFNNCFKCFRYLRNSLHNNGVHNPKNDDFIYTIKGFNYIFKKNQVHYNASWEYIFTLLHKCYLYLDEIFMQKRFKNEEFIKDNSAYQRSDLGKESDAFISSFLKQPTHP
jgi:hypothetical protein